MSIEETPVGQTVTFADGSYLMTSLSSDDASIFPLNGRFYYHDYDDNNVEHWYSAKADDGSDERAELANIIPNQARRMMMTRYIAPPPEREHTEAETAALAQATRICRTRLDQVFGGAGASEFDQVLIRKKGLVAGSFPLQCVIDETWVEGDIDVWLPFQQHIPPCSATTEGKEAIERINERCLLNEFLRRQQYKLKRVAPFDQLPVEYVRLRKVKQISIWVDDDSSRHRRRPPIQVLEIKMSGTLDRLLFDFDLDICRAVYSPLKGVIMLSSDYQNAIARRMSLTEGAAKQTWMEWIRTAKRIVKYSNRGFTLTPDRFNFAELVYETLRSRIGRLQEWYDRFYVEFRGVVEDPDNFDALHAFAKFRNLETQTLRTVEAWNMIMTRSERARNILPTIYIDTSGPRMQCVVDSFTDADGLMAVSITADAEEELVVWYQDEMRLAEVDVPETSLPTMCYNPEKRDYLTPDSFGETLAANREKPMNVMILSPQNRGDAACFSRSALVQLMANHAKQTVECSPTVERPLLYLPTKGRSAYVQLVITNAIYLVSLVELAVMLYTQLVGNHSTFMLVRDVPLERTAGRESIEQNDFVSGHHCQAGTDRFTYRLLRVNSV